MLNLARMLLFRAKELEDCSKAHYKARVLNGSFSFKLAAGETPVFLETC